MGKSGDYKVGRGRPPVETRWKPGQSGNPRGRPKGAKNLATLFNEALNQKVQLKSGGEIRSVSKREGLAHRVVQDAMNGNLKAVQVLLNFEPEIEPETPARITTIRRVFVEVKDGKEVVFGELPPRN
jgi:hypothetical protein